MKTSASLLTLFLLLADCGSHGPSGVVWTSDDVQATVFQSDGMVSQTQKYSFDVSTRKLTGQWTQLGRGEHHAELLLSADQASQLEERLARVRLESTTRGGCANDAPELSLEIVEPSGETRLYATRPEISSCGSPRTFAVEEDVRAVLDACNTLLPEPPR
jgi:hypothetical protein